MSEQEEITPKLQQIFDDFMKSATIQENLLKQLFFSENDIELDNMEFETGYTNQTSYQIEGRIRSIRKLLQSLKGQATRILKPKSSDDVLPYRQRHDITAKVRGIENQAKLEIDQLESLKTHDKISNSTELVWTGTNAVLWYDEPLSIFIQGDLFKELQKPSQPNDQYGIRTALRKLQNLSASIEHITICAATTTYTIDKSLLIMLLQYLVAIESALKMNHQRNKVRKDRINRAVYKIHHDLQISPDRTMKICQEIGMNCTINCIIQRSSEEFFKHEMPEWVKNLEQTP